MSWNPPEEGKTFRAGVFVVDDTYWDDGNRTTRRDHDFATLSEAVAFKRDALMKRWYETTSWQTKERFRKWLDDDDVRLYRYDGKWREVEDCDLVTLLGEVAGD